MGQNAADPKIALEDLSEDLGSPASLADGAPGSAAATPSTRRRETLRGMVYATAILAVTAAGFGAADAIRPWTVPAPDLRPFITEAVPVGVPVWSPDGRTLAYVASAVSSRFSCAASTRPNRHR